MSLSSESLLSDISIHINEYNKLNREIESKFLIKDKIEKTIILFYQDFNKKITSINNISKYLKNPDFFNLNDTNDFAEIYSIDNILKIKSENEEKNYDKYFQEIKLKKQKIDNSKKFQDMKIYKTINLNNLNSDYFENIYLNTNLYGFLEIKINREIYRNNYFLKYTENKDNNMTKKILIEDILINDCFNKKYFYINNIELEILPLNELLFENISYSLINKIFKNNFYEKLLPNYFNNINYEKILDNYINKINNYFLLNVLEYFSFFICGSTLTNWHYDYLEIKIFMRKIFNLNFENKKRFGKEKKIKNINKNNNNNNNNISININNSSIYKNELLYDEIKNELEKKEKIINVNNNNKENKFKYTHFYINNENFTKEQYDIIIKFLQKNNYKLFCWYHNKEETIKMGIKNILKVGFLKTKNLYFYLNTNSIV